MVLRHHGVRACTPERRKSKKLQWCFAASRVSSAPRKEEKQEISVVLRHRAVRSCTPERGKTRNFSGEQQENVPLYGNALRQKRGGRMPPAKKLLTGVNKAGNCHHPSRHHIPDIHQKNKNPQKPPKFRRFTPPSKRKIKKYYFSY